MAKTEGKVCAVIVSAGTSSRMGGVDKIFADVAGQPIIARVLDVFQGCSLIDGIVVVLSKSNLERGQHLVRESGWSKVIDVCAGGARRQDSVREGLSRLKGCSWVLVHDGARPCVTPDLIERGLAAAQKTGAAIAAVPVVDTIKVVSGDCFVKETPRRETLWAVQTPQVFRYDLLVEAHRHFKVDVTDDSMLVEQMGHKVKVFAGSYHNIKVTTPDDMCIVEAFFRKDADAPPK